MSNKSEGFAYGVINLGSAIFIGLCYGFFAGLIMFIVIYTIIGIFEKWCDKIFHDNNNNISIWNWFLESIKND